MGLTWHRRQMAVRRRVSGVLPERLNARLRRGYVARRDRGDMRRLERLIEAELPEDADCVDVGAHVGAVLEAMVRACPGGKHVAYEPLPHLHADLVQRFPDVEVRPTALWDRSGESAFVHVVGAPGYSGLRERSYPGPQQLERLTVRTETLDTSLPKGCTPAFIKIDVEGAEGQVIEGGMETICRYRPLVFFEHGRAAWAYGTRATHLFELLCGRAGLEIFDADGRGPYDAAEMEALSGAIWSFVARP